VLSIDSVCHCPGGNEVEDLGVGEATFSLLSVKLEGKK
jgi:hypothetical protein